MHMIYYLVLFLAFYFLILLPCGKVVLKFLKAPKMSLLEDLLLSTNLGIIFLAILTLVLNLIGLKEIIPIIIWLPLIYLIFSKSYLNFKEIKDFFSKKNLAIILLVILSFLVQGGVLFTSGGVENNSLKLIGAHTSDSLWYLALIEKLKLSIPPENPTFSGIPLTNYHFLSFIIFSVFSNITQIPTEIVYFKIIGPFLILLFILSVYKFIQVLTKSKLAGCLAILLVTLSSNYYYLVNFFYQNTQFNPSIAWVDEYSTRLVNLQLLSSYLVILTILSLWLKFSKINYRFILTFSILVAALTEFKIFGGVIFLGSLILVCIYKLFKKDYSLVKLTSVSLIFSGAFFSYVNSGLAQQALLISPFWLIKAMNENADRLNNSVWELKRQTYLVHQNFIRISQLYLEGLIIFLLVNFGTRFAGFWVMFKSKYKNRELEIIHFLVFGSVLGLIFSMVFITRGIAWNTVQFLYYSTFFFNLLLVISLNQLISKRRYLGIFLALLIWFSLLPGVFYTSNAYFTNTFHSGFSSELYSASFFLKDKASGVVLIDPFYNTNSYISAISKKTAFFADESRLFNNLLDYGDRMKKNTDFFSDKMTATQKKQFINENQIKYIFTSNSAKELNNLKLQKIFQNNQISIFSTN